MTLESTLRFLTSVIPMVAIMVACGPQTSKRTKVQAPRSGETTTSTTEFEPKASAIDKAKVKEALVKLMQYPSGADILMKVRPLGFEDILPPATKISPLSCIVSLENSEQIKGRNGHSGGGIEKRADGVYIIHANEGADADLLAHIIRHEMNHILDDVGMDTINDQNYSNITTHTIAALKTRKPEVIDQINSKHLEYVLSVLMCGEIRSYDTNRILADEGLPFRTFDLKKEDLSLYVNKAYLEPFYRKFSDEDAIRVGESCRASPTLLDYHSKISKTLLAP